MRTATTHASQLHNDNPTVYDRLYGMAMHERKAYRMLMAYADKHLPFLKETAKCRWPLLEYVQKTRRDLTTSSDRQWHKLLNDITDTVFSRVMSNVVANDRKRLKGERLRLAERLKTCGKMYGIKQCPDNHKQLERSYCNHPKLCRRCARRDSRKKADALFRSLQKLLAKKMVGYNLRFLTVTTKVSGKGIKYDTRRLIQAFPKLWRSLYRRDGTEVSSAMRCIEIGSENGMAHAHVLMWTKFKSVEEIRRLWKEKTGDSFVIHVKKVITKEKEIREACGEVCKYMTDLDKVIEKHGVEEGCAFLSGIARELKGMHMTQKYGCALPHVFERRMGFKAPLPPKNETQFRCGCCGKLWSSFTDIVEPRGPPLLRVV